MELTRSNKTALLFGATGLVGSQLLQQLLAEPAYRRVVTISRRPLETEHERLTSLVFPLDELERHQHRIGPVNDVYIALGTTRKTAGSDEAFRRVDLNYVVAAARVAQANGASQCLLVSSAGADAESRLLYPRTKGEAEAAVAEIGFWAVRIFRPGVLLGDRREFRLGERIGAAVTTLLRKVSPAVLGDYNPVEAEVLARRMIEAARDITGGHRLYSAQELIS